MIFEDDETLRMYVEESLEHLEDIESNLLKIEEDGADIDDDLVNDVFRAAHSIKGGAGFMGLNGIKELAHKIENILGMVRGNEVIPTPDTVSKLLKAFDKLREMIEDVENSNDIDIADHIQILVALASSSLPEEQQDTVTKLIEIPLPGRRAKFCISQFDIDQAKKSGKYIYLVEYDLITDIHRRKKNPIEVFNSLLSSGIIIETMVDLESVGTLEENHVSKRLPFLILYASIIEEEIIPVLFGVDPSRVHNLSDEIPPSLSLKSITSLPETDNEPVEKSPESKESLPNIKPSTTDTIPQQAAAVQAPPVAISNEPQQDENAGHKAPNQEEREHPVKTGGAQVQTSLRVSVSLLDLLMTLAGELVLSRNQLIQGVAANNVRAMEQAGQRINLVTSELQEAIMKTRMQSVANVFNKYPRVVRDLARDLNKEIDLTIEGKDVELDKTIIEAIGDPLTHLVRNSVDHGIEPPLARAELGKDAVGKVFLRAYHEAGQVNIEISDDGRGLNGEQLAASAVKKGLITEQQANLMSEKEKINLIFLPGFSTAKEITDVSGRGVGMDVVKTNLDRLGGVIDIDSKVGRGTTINIKLPLTLAIIPSQIIFVGEERYAIPQVNLNELLRIPGNQVKNRIERVGDADVVRLRGNLLPLLNVSQLLSIERYYVNPQDGKKYPEQRLQIADRRSRKTKLFNDEEAPDYDILEKDVKPRKHTDRRYRASSAINIAVVSTGTFTYGLVVDQLCDSEEIVVKPLGRHLKSCLGYAGATIMGDGKVALILDVAGLTVLAELTSMEGADRVSQAAKEAEREANLQKDRTAWLLFRNAESDQYGVPLNLVERIERIKKAEIEAVGGRKVIQYRGGTLPLVSLDEVANIKSIPERDQYEVIVFKLKGREVGLMAIPPVDAVELSLNIDEISLRQPGIMGSAIINQQTTLLVDIFEVVQTLHPDWFEHKAAENLAENAPSTILFAEDSAFFRVQVRRHLEGAGYHVIEAEDGLKAWELLEEHADDVDLILTDLEMPNMNGFEFTMKIKADERFKHLKVVALTSLAGDKDILRGEKAGIDDYQIKLDREKVMASIKSFLKQRKKIR